MNKIYDILVLLLGESKQGCYDKNITQYQFNCPYCAEEKGYVDGKYNLEVSFSLGKFHCWSCGNSGTISKLINSIGGKTYYDEYFSIIKDIKESKYYNLDLFKDNGDIFSENFLKLPKTFRKINLFSCKDKQLCEYLQKRGITQNEIDLYNIGRTLWDGEEYYWRNRIIIPSYNEYGDLNYYVGRTYKDGDKRSKYKNCDADKKKIVFGESIINYDADIYLCEGIFDSLVFPNAVPFMGKSLTRDSDLYQKIYERANSRVVICLDDDTSINETKRIYKLLDRGRLRGKVYYIRLGTDELPWKDFSEAYESGGKENIIKIFSSAKKFSEMDLLI